MLAPLLFLIFVIKTTTLNWVQGVVSIYFSIHVHYSWEYDLDHILLVKSLSSPWSTAPISLNLMMTIFPLYLEPRTIRSTSVGLADHDRTRRPLTSGNVESRSEPVRSTMLCVLSYYYHFYCWGNVSNLALAFAVHFLCLSTYLIATVKQLTLQLLFQFMRLKECRALFLSWSLKSIMTTNGPPLRYESISSCNNFQYQIAIFQANPREVIQLYLPISNRIWDNIVRSRGQSWVRFISILHCSKYYQKVLSHIFLKLSKLSS